MVGGGEGEESRKGRMWKRDGKGGREVWSVGEDAGGPKCTVKGLADPGRLPARHR